MNTIRDSLKKANRYYPIYIIKAMPLNADEYREKTKNLRKAMKLDPSQKGDGYAILNEKTGWIGWIPLDLFYTLYQEIIEEDIGEEDENSTNSGS